MNRQSNITSNEIELWCAYDDEIRDPALLTSYCELLNKEEAEQHKRFYFEQHRHQYLITRALVRTVLSHYTDGKVSPDEWSFDKNKYGKPFITNPSYENFLRFNISHSDKLVVMAINRNHEVGVDVESLDRNRNVLDLAHHYFSSIEVDGLNGLMDELKEDRFFDLWTLKEAYIKACGMGLSIPLNQFSFEFTPEGRITITFAPERIDQPSDWQFYQVRPHSHHKIALAIKADAVSQRCSVIMNKVVPMSSYQNVSYPIVRQS